METILLEMWIMIGFFYIEWKILINHVFREETTTTTYIQHTQSEQ